MEKCMFCGEPVKNKYCNVSCQNRHQNKGNNDKRYGKFMDFIVECNSCGKDVTVAEREKLHPQKGKYYCGRSCANIRLHNDETKKKISESLSKPITMIKCKSCNLDFVPRRKTTEFCCQSCSSTYLNSTDKMKKISVLAGQKSARTQSENRRSKNEIHFAELCENHFNKVLTNEPMFNGWDADVVIEDIKVAVLWNGVWHYKKITEKHSVNQVQNRDKIKIKEIKNLGYTPYIIKDMGSENKDFVNEKFHTFLKDMEL